MSKLLHLILATTLAATAAATSTTTNLDLTCVAVPEMEPQVTVCVNLTSIAPDPAEDDPDDDGLGAVELDDYFLTDPLSDCPAGSILVSSEKECRYGATPFIINKHGRSTVDKYEGPRYWNRHAWPCGCVMPHKPQWTGNPKVKHKIFFNTFSCEQGSDTWSLEWRRDNNFHGRRVCKSLGADVYLS